MLAAPARRLALAALALACAVAALSPSRAQPPEAQAYLLVSPNTCPGLDVEEAQRRISSSEHARYRRFAADVLLDLGVFRPRVHDAVGEWQGSAENSLFVAIHQPVDEATLAYAAASFGLEAKQKMVLAFRVGPGRDVLAFIDLHSLAEARDLLDRHGAFDRTLVPHSGGWRAVVLAEGGRADALRALPGAKLSHGRAVVLGAPTADGARERYREVIRAHRAAAEVAKLSD